ncbi:DNA ligase 6 [Linum perenne]
MASPQSLDSLLLHHRVLSSLSLPPPPSRPASSPPSKSIPGTRFLVDAFRHFSSSTSYFLSHFHSDHYSGLHPNWSHGVIFCSRITADLVTTVLGVPQQFVFALPMRETVIIDGSEVTLVDANHCPGAVQFLFKVPVATGFEMYVHTGDFRYIRSMSEDDLLRGFVGCDAVFLDTTYCNPKFVFPTQDEAVDYVANVIDNVRKEEKKVLFLIATYVIGKERILLETARRCKAKVLVDRRKMEVLQVLGYGENEGFTEDKLESDIHVVGWNVLGETWPYFRPNFVKMTEIMEERGYSRVIGFVPTGWTYEVKKSKFSVRKKDSCEVHLVPYSEHSNYDELREYVKFLRPKRVIPTVGVDIEKLDGKEVAKMQKHFAGLVDQTANKKEFLTSFLRGSTGSNKNMGCDGLADPNVGLKVQKVEDSSDLIALIDAAPLVVSNSLEIPQAPDSVDVAVLDDEEKQRIVKELSDCLPTWVTHDQMLQLVSRSGRNIVEAVSNFYERETEFHEQVLACKPSISRSQIDTLDSSNLLLKPESTSKTVKLGKSGISLSQRSKSSGVKSSPGKSSKSSGRSGSSPGKRKKNLDVKTSKKARSTSKVESDGSKQSTITKFFSKICPNTSEDSKNQKIPEPPHGDESLLLDDDDDANLYKAEIGQFVQIIGGNESVKSYAATILEKTKGDVNKALDLHYANPESIPGKNSERLAVSDKLVQPQSVTNEQSYTQGKTSLQEEGVGFVLSVKEPAVECSDASLISLPAEKYDPLKHACWKSGQPAPYIHLARTFDLVEAEKGKIKATSMLCNMFRSILALSPDDLLAAIYLCTDKIAADHENMELNIGGSLVTSALTEACGPSASVIREMYNNIGDLGDVAQLCWQTKKRQKLLAPTPPLLVRDVFSALHKISSQTGSKSTGRKKSIIVNMMCACQEKEMKFLVRTLSLSAAVVEAYNILPNLDMLVPSLVKNGIGFTSSTLSMDPGTPIKPMLAKITNGVSQVLKSFENKAFTCEFKYDGQRAQIHRLSNGTIHVFSRNGDETTSRFPDVINIIEGSRIPTTDTFIIDAEVVAVDRKNGCKLMSFQELSSRERGGKDSLITLDNIKVEICLFVFDIMFANGEQLLKLSLRQRRKYLKDLFSDARPGYFQYAEEMTVEAQDACLSNDSTLERMNSFLEDAWRCSCEGIMVKTLDEDAGYCPSKRADSWLKVKRDYVEGLGDSLDLVPIGAWHGNGRKAGWYSPFLMACYNPETEEFQSVCRVMSGFSDAFYKEMKEFFSDDRILSKKPPYYRTGEAPDMWFSAEIVWEIRGADFTVSPVHQAAVGLVHESRGISIRFPRFVRSVSDRKPEECSSAGDIAQMFNAQPRRMGLTDGD